MQSGKPRSTASPPKARSPLLSALQEMLELADLRPDHDRAISLVWVLREVILVIVLGRPKLRQRHDLRRDRVAARLLGVGQRLFGRTLLGGIGKEDYRAVLASHVVSLPANLCRIMNLPEVLEDPVERDNGRVEVHLHDLGVPCLLGANLL